MNIQKTATEKLDSAHMILKFGCIGFWIFTLLAHIVNVYTQYPQGCQVYVIELMRIPKNLHIFCLHMQIKNKI